MAKCKTTLEKTTYIYTGNDQDLDNIIDTIIQLPTIFNLIKEERKDYV